MSIITKLPNGKYRIQVYDEFGKRHRPSFDKKSEAESYIRKIEARKHELSQIHHNLIRVRVSIDQAIQDFWLDKLSIRTKSRVKYEYELKQIKTFCQTNSIAYVDEFTRQHADEFRQLLINTGAAPKTINSYLSRLRAVFTEQVNRDVIVRNPASHLKNLSLQRKSLLERENDYYTEPEVIAFFGQDMDTVYREALLGLFLTGLRFEELANLTWDRIDFDNRMLMIRTTETFITKTSAAERNIPISNMLYLQLKDKFHTRQSEFVFPSKQNKKLSERTLLTVCKRYAVAAGINKDATLHKFRHTFSSLLSQYGIAYEVREYLLGHKPKGSLTAHYTKLDPNKFHYVVNILDKIPEGKQ